MMFLIGSTTLAFAYIVLRHKNKLFSIVIIFSGIVFNFALFVNGDDILADYRSTVFLQCR